MFEKWVKDNNLPGGDKRVTNDPMEATFVGIHMWKQAVEKAKSADVDKVRVAMIGQTFNAPSGFVLTMDGNHHPDCRTTQRARDHRQLGDRASRRRSACCFRVDSGRRRTARRR
jgi:hypothetical protein